MKEATVIIAFTLKMDDNVLDLDTYFRQAGQSIIDDIPGEWWEINEETLHIASARIVGLVARKYVVG